jgi:hypothetical protein
MKTDIRTKHVNLLTGLFDLSYTAFADYIVSPQKEQTEMEEDKKGLKGSVTIKMSVVENCWFT